MRGSTLQAWSAGALRFPSFLAVLYAATSAAVFGFAVDFAVLVRSSCGIGEVGYLCVGETHFASRVRSSVVLLSSACVTLHYCYKVWQILCYQRHKLPTWACSLLRLRKRADAWVSAASLDLFDETARFLQSTNLLLGGLMVPFTVTLGAALSIGSYSEYVERWSDPKLVRQCGTDDLCYVAKCFIPCFMASNAMLLTSASICIHTIPAVAWSSTMELAMQKTGDPRVRRLMWLPYLCSLAYVLGLSLLAHQQTRVPRRLNVASAMEVKLNFITQMVTCVYIIVILWFNMLLQDTASFVLSVLTRRQPVFDSERRHTGRATADDIARRGVVPTVGQSISEASAIHRRETLLLIHLLLWSNRVLSRTPLWEFVVLTLMRVIAFVILLTTHERRSNFHTIEKRAGFGLVIKASELKRSLTQFVDRECVEWEPSALPATPSRASSGRREVVVVKTTEEYECQHLYKATLYRMRDTLAVSYRWQEVDTRVSEHISLNMNEFQLRALLTAIERSRCQYVWLDRLSVPQDDCPLKFTLLARMMAVYAAAGATIALRTAEVDGSRYHQRVWTFPEYCASTNLHVVTQHASGVRQIEQAVVGDEENVATRLRERLQSLQVSLVPLWLREENNTVTPVEAAEVLTQYRWLAAKLRCKFPEDKIRALLPLLMQSPVESQGELIKLVLLLSKASGEELHDWKMCLFEQHLDRQRAMQSEISNIDRAVHDDRRRPHLLRGWLDSVARIFRDAATVERSGRAWAVNITDENDTSTIQQQQKRVSLRASISSPGECESTSASRKTSTSVFEYAVEESDDGWGDPEQISLVPPRELRVSPGPRDTPARQSQDQRGRRVSFSSFDVGDSRQASRAEGYISAVGTAEAREMRRARLEQITQQGHEIFANAPPYLSLPGGVPGTDNCDLTRWSSCQFPGTIGRTVTFS